MLSTARMSEADVLEVRDLAHAIERAERVIREQKSSYSSAPPSSREPDIFDALIGTDDIAGSAVYAPVTLTPIPPRIPTPFPSSATMEPELFATTALPGKPATLALPVNPPPRAPQPQAQPQTQTQTQTQTLRPAIAPPPFVRADGSELTPPMIPAATHTAPILVLDPEGFKYPAGRIPGFAPDLYPSRGVYRPDLAPLTPQEKRRELMTWLVAGGASLFGLVAIFFVCLSLGRAHTTQAASTSTLTAPIAAKAETPAIAPAPAPAPSPSPTPAIADAREKSSVPVYDVKSLKSAPKSRRH